LLFWGCLRKRRERNREKVEGKGRNVRDEGRFPCRDPEPFIRASNLVTAVRAWPRKAPLHQLKTPLRSGGPPGNRTKGGQSLQRHAHVSIDHFLFVGSSLCSEPRTAIPHGQSHPVFLEQCGISEKPPVANAGARILGLGGGVLACAWLHRNGYGSVC